MVNKALVDIVYNDMNTAVVIADHTNPITFAKLVKIAFIVKLCL